MTYQGLADVALCGMLDVAGNLFSLEAASGQEAQPLCKNLSMSPWIFFFPTSRIEALRGRQ